MSEQCAYDSDGRYAVRDLQSECRGLREDLDNLLTECQDLRRQLGTLRSRADFNELVAP